MTEREGLPVAETVAFVLERHVRMEIALMRVGGPSVFNGRRPDPPQLTSGCYAASFGTVHVRPGCHCPR